MSSLLKISVSLSFIFFSLTADGGDQYRITTGATEAGMGYSCITRSGFWSSFHNQASLAFNKSLSFGFNYENRFMINELGSRSAGIIIPSGKASIAALYSHFGYTDFRRQKGAFACGLKLSDIIAAGIQIDYFSEKTSGEYDDYQMISCEAGLIINPKENISIGIHIFNPVPNSLRKTNMPSIIRAGAGINLSSTLFTAAEAEISSGTDLNLKTGFEYEAAKNMMLRGGFATRNSSFSFGLGYIIKFTQIDLGFVTHERLGVSSSVSLIFKIH